MKTPDYGREIFDNRNQGTRKRVLFICTGGILRSPTAAHWAAQFHNWNTRSAGIMGESVPPVNSTLIKWAHRIYCMEEKHKEELITKFSYAGIGQWVGDKTEVLDIPDLYDYMDPDLIAMLEIKLPK